ncbi:MAG: hypothetical protein LBT00_05625 [Spirochaetaceae bacterium]|nr:hypothetical protein [Spirochaetaceae bacterium]
MDRTDEVIYLAGLPGVPRMILWVKISPEGVLFGAVLPADCRFLNSTRPQEAYYRPSDKLSQQIALKAFTR